MLTLEPVDKVQIICLHSQTKQAVEALYEFGAIQVTRSKHGAPDMPQQEFQQISEELIELRAIESLLKLGGETQKRMPSELKQLVSSSKKLRAEFEQAKKALDKIEQLKNRHYALLPQQKTLAAFKNLQVSPATFSKTSKLLFEYGLLKVPDKEMQHSLKGKPAEFSLARSDDGKQYALVAFARENLEVPAILNRLFSEKLSIPQVSEKSFAAALEKTAEEIRQIGVEQNNLAQIVQEFRKKRSAAILQLRADLEEHAKLAELSNKFGHTDFLEVIDGWVPTKNFRELQSSLVKATGGIILVEKIASSDKRPTILNNPLGVRRFEFLVNFFSLPDPHELDPTLWIAITFPIIFGMIFGDIGYGLLAVAIGAFLRLKGRGFFKDIGGMMALSGASTVLFGFVFGEFFGGEEMLGFHLTPMIHRAGEGIPLLFGITLVVGIIHLALGLLIGFVTNLRAKHYNHAVGKLSWLVVEFSLVGLVYSILFRQQALGLPSLIGVLLGFSCLVIFEGAVALVEVPGLLANGLSYLRILALGLSGVIIALIINQIPLNASIAALAKSVSTAGNFDPINFVAALFTTLFFGAMLVLGHGMALALGLFESGIQSLRLHYVEFFSKFYHGGGIPFVPLREKRG